MLVIQKDYTNDYSGFSKQIDSNRNYINSAFPEYSKITSSSKLFVSYVIPINTKQDLYYELIGLLTALKSKGLCSDREYQYMTTLAQSGFIYRPAILSNTDQLENEARRAWWKENGFESLWLRSLKISDTYTEQIRYELEQKITLYDMPFVGAYSVLKFDATELKEKLASLIDKHNKEAAKVKEQYNYAKQNFSSTDMVEINTMKKKLDDYETYIALKFKEAGGSVNVSGLSLLQIAVVPISFIVLSLIVALLVTVVSYYAKDTAQFYLSIDKKKLEIDQAKITANESVLKRLEQEKQQKIESIQNSPTLTYEQKQQQINQLTTDYESKMKPYIDEINRLGGSSNWGTIALVLVAGITIPVLAYFAYNKYKGKIGFGGLK
jgi:ElaB/YqjD/DUF883 family membrane-anchored ribosome-binding protein